MATSGFSAATAVRCSPVKGQRTVVTVGLYCGRSVPAEARSTAKAIYVPYSPTEGSSESPDGARRRTADAAADPWDGRIGREGQLRELLKARAPGLEQRDLSPVRLLSDEGVTIDVGGPEYTRQDEQFLNAVAAGRSVESDVQSALQVQRVVEAVYESSANGRSVSLEP